MRKYFLIPTIFLFLFQTQVSAQAIDCKRKVEVLKPWSINTNYGKTSYFGDLSIHDKNIPNKISQESCSSFGLIVTKHFNKVLGLSGQTIFGHLKALNRKCNFRTQIFEYNIHGRFDITHLLSGNTVRRYGVVGYAGIGHLLFKTTKITEVDLKTHEVISKTNVPEFIYFFGGSIYYNLSNKIGITADLALKQFQNDRLDDCIEGNNFDYYSYLSFGISYHFYK